MIKNIFASVVLLFGVISLAHGATIDELLERYQERRQQKFVVSYDLETENNRLKNELLDLTVEKDRLEAYIEYLESKLENKLSMQENTCVFEGCMSFSEVEREKTLIHILYHLRLYEAGIKIKENSLNIEAQREAQKIIEDALEGLELLGFDTTNPDTFPTEEEFVEYLDNVEKQN